MLHLVPTLTTVPSQKKIIIFLPSSLEFSFIKNIVPDITNLDIAPVSLFPILGVEHDIASYTNTTIPGLVSLNIRYILTV